RRRQQAGRRADCTVGTMHLQHPTVGDIDVDYQVWLQPESPDHRLEVYTPNDTASADALRLLSNQVADQRKPEAGRVEAVQQPDR
ncbi:transcriptional regulator, partial [Streptomyces sp. AA8]|uniref:MmyB family transcriptional regulator n=1 Tax=Streptomyces telluris TaxID=2720021 RepID=UPI0016A8C1ED|nr:transcriptional regulator [Streptomyces telluris]